MKFASRFHRRATALAAAAAAMGALALPAVAQVTPTDPNATPGSVAPQSSTTAPAGAPAPGGNIPSGPGIGWGTAPPLGVIVTGTSTGSTGIRAATSAAAAPIRTAQSSSSADMAPSRSAYARDDGYSLLPYTRRGYLGLNVGRPTFKSPCGAGGYGCDDPDASMHLYTGGYFNDWLGLEVGYLYTGQADRAGGQVSGQGVDLNVVLRAPLGGSFAGLNLYAKGGGIYSQTKQSAGLLSGLANGKRRGWGASYAAGVGYDFGASSGVVLEWSRHELLFPGGGRENVDNTSLGYVYRF